MLSALYWYRACSFFLMIILGLLIFSFTMAGICMLLLLTSCQCSIAGFHNFLVQLRQSLPVGHVMLVSGLILLTLQFTAVWNKQQLYLDCLEVILEFLQMPESSI